jgi:hypothetical protein
MMCQWFCWEVDFNLGVKPTCEAGFMLDSRRILFSMALRATDAIGWTLRATAIEPETRCAG